jgi:mRNA interferase RelE/StbE
MSAFQVILTPEAQIDLKRLDSAIQTRLLERLEWMAANAALLRHQPLHGDEWRGCFKYRVGDYRIIYQLDRASERMVILKVGHRREVYG